MIYIILCDDDAKILNEIIDYINKIRSRLKHDIETITYTNAKSVLKRIKNPKECSDVLITDISMPGLSGMEMAEIIRNCNIDIILIFLTAHTEYVYKSFEYSPFRYIRKEFMKEELLPALQAACEKINTRRNTSISIKTKDGILAIQIKDIIYYELENRKCVIYTIQNQQYKTWKKISELQKEIKSKGYSFIQVYKGCVVNKHYIKTIKKDMLILENGLEIPVSRRKKQEISSIMMDFWNKNV